MFKIAIIGASGYTGGELLRMLLNHPKVEITDITSRQYDGTPAHKIHPHIRDSGLVFKNKSPPEFDAKSNILADHFYKFNSRQGDKN